LVLKLRVLYYYRVYPDADDLVALLDHLALFGDEDVFAFEKERALEARTGFRRAEAVELQWDRGRRWFRGVGWRWRRGSRFCLRRGGILLLIHWNLWIGSGRRCLAEIEQRPVPAFERHVLKSRHQVGTQRGIHLHRIGPVLRASRVHYRPKIANRAATRDT